MREETQRYSSDQYTTTATGCVCAVATSHIRFEATCYKVQEQFPVKLENLIVISKFAIIPCVYYCRTVYFLIVKIDFGPNFLTISLY